jgi:hypothetical protein
MKIYIQKDPPENYCKDDIWVEVKDNSPKTTIMPKNRFLGIQFIVMLLIAQFIIFLLFVIFIRG